MSPRTSKPATKQSKDKKPIINYGAEPFLMLCTNIVSKIGIPGFLVISFVSYLFAFTSSNQKTEIVDKWILFKNNNYNQELTILVVIFAIVLYSIEAYAFYRIRKLDQDEIARLSEFKRLYQEQQLGVKLSNSSKPKN
ncbi:hypothetical protein AB6735_15495 [Mucilaginibacter sp. RCC_168]|uniref:hypothetical protein n=1 Tax=Mucilaginibacter sp. RCC_168 TaxID=3239221 RepID=UPI003523B8E7